MVKSPPSPGRRRLQLAGAVVVALALPTAALVLYYFPPKEGSFYPRCPFFLLTGLHCPGCGGTRCLHALLHGQLLQAAAYNSLTLLCIPPLALYGLVRGNAALTGKSITGPRLPAWSIWLLFFVIMAFWILRNVNAYPFSLLAPHDL